MKIYKFGASWCKPCATLEPIFNKVTSEFENLEAIHIDCEDDDAQELINKYQIRNLPTVILTDGDNVIDRFTGLLSESEFRSRLTNLLS